MAVWSMDWGVAPGMLRRRLSVSNCISSTGCTFGQKKLGRLRGANAIMAHHLGS